MFGTGNYLGIGTNLVPINAANAQHTLKHSTLFYGKRHGYHVQNADRAYVDVMQAALVKQAAERTTRHATSCAGTR